MALATLDTFRAQLDAMPEAEREELLEALVTAYETEGQNIDSEEDYAGELRDTRMPGMRDAGRFKVAANPLEHLAAGAARGMGHYGGFQARDKRSALGARQTAAMGQLQNMLLGGGGGGARAPGPAAHAAALRGLGGR